MRDSLSNLVDNLSGIDNNESKNKFVDTIRSINDSLSQSINKTSQSIEKYRKVLRKN